MHNLISYRRRKKSRKSQKDCLHDRLQDGFNFENETWASMSIKQKTGSKEEVTNWICFKLTRYICSDVIYDLIRKN